MYSSRFVHGGANDFVMSMNGGDQGKSGRMNLIFFFFVLG